MTRQYVPRDIREMLEEELLRDLVVRYPDLMPVLGEFDIEYDNVAGRTFVEAARMHGYEPDTLIDQAMKVVTFERR
jgi:hypothetical protein